MKIVITILLLLSLLPFIAQSLPLAKYKFKYEDYNTASKSFSNKISFNQYAVCFNETPLFSTDELQFKFPLLNSPTQSLYIDSILIPS